MLKVRLIKKAKKNCSKHGITFYLRKRRVVILDIVSYKYYFCSGDCRDTPVTLYRLWRLAVAKNKEEIEYILGMDI